MPIIIVPTQELNAAKDEFNPQNVIISFSLASETFRNGLRKFGLISGCYFLVIAVALLAMYCVLFNLIKYETKLSQTL